MGRILSVSQELPLHTLQSIVPPQITDYMLHSKVSLYQKSISVTHHLTGIQWSHFLAQNFADPIGYLGWGSTLIPNSADEIIWPVHPKYRWKMAQGIRRAFGFQAKNNLTRFSRCPHTISQPHVKILATVILATFFCFVLNIFSTHELYA